MTVTKWTWKEKASSTNKIISAFPPCPDNLTLNNFSNNEVESVKNVIDTVRKIPFSQPSCEKKKISCTKPEEIHQINDLPIIFGDCVSLAEEHEEQELQEIVHEIPDSNIKKYFN